MRLNLDFAKTLVGRLRGSSPEEKPEYQRQIHLGKNEENGLLQAKYIVLRNGLPWVIANSGTMADIFDLANTVADYCRTNQYTDSSFDLFSKGLDGCAKPTGEVMWFAPLTESDVDTIRGEIAKSGVNVDYVN